MFLPKNKKKVIETDYGLASSYNEVIEINKRLPKKLKEKILIHEQSHDNGEYSANDFKIDFHAEKPHFFEAFIFSLKHPEALVSYFLVMYSYYFKVFTWNQTAIYSFLYYLVIWTILFISLFRINLFLAILGYICFYVITNIVLLLYTHWYVCNR
jgi:hypothetical protein